MRDASIENGSDHERQEFVHQIALHAPVFGPWLARRVKIKTGAHAEVPRFSLTRHAGAARTRVRHQERNAELRQPFAARLPSS